MMMVGPRRSRTAGRHAPRRPPARLASQAIAALCTAKIQCFSLYPAMRPIRAANHFLLTYQPVANLLPLLGLKNTGKARDFFNTVPGILVYLCGHTSTNLIDELDGARCT